MDEGSLVQNAHVTVCILLLHQSEGVEVWLGVTGGVSPLLRVYPSPALEWMWDRDTASLNSFLVSASLALDSQGHLVAVRNTFTTYTVNVFYGALLSGSQLFHTCV